MFLKRASFALVVAAVASACSGQKTETPAAAAAPAAAAPATAAPAAADDGQLPSVASPYDALPEGVRGLMDKPFTGDYDEMVQRRLIRMGVTFNRTHYFIDGGQQRGRAPEVR